MKPLSKLAAIFAALVLACAFVGCSDGSDDSTAAYVGTYECSFSPTDGVNVTMTLVTKDDETFTMTQAVTYSGGSESETITGTYEVSGTTVTISFEVGDEGETVSLTGTTSDNWKTIVVEIPADEGEDSESYTFTKK